jgi:hypothetical protein
MAAHCTYWFNKSEVSVEASKEERCDCEAWFWSQTPEKDPHATGLSGKDYRAKPATLQILLKVKVTDAQVVSTEYVTHLGALQRNGHSTP